jgi:hypothetical protein
MDVVNLIIHDAKEFDMSVSLAEVSPTAILHCLTVVRRIGSHHNVELLHDGRSIGVIDGRALQTAINRILGKRQWT